MTEEIFDAASQSNSVETQKTHKETLLGLYGDESYQTLYRFENPKAEYDESREGITSKREIIGDWFTDNFRDLLAYTLTRGKLGGHFTLVRVSKDRLHEWEAKQLEQTRDMDIEPGNYVIPKDIQVESKIEVPLGLTSVKNIMKVREFIVENLNDEAVVSFIGNNLKDEGNAVN